MFSCAKDGGRGGGCNLCVVCTGVCLQQGQDNTKVLVYKVGEPSQAGAQTDHVPKGTLEV